MPEIRIIDTTLRDAHQCLWATRMTTAMMLPVADAMDRCGFEAIDLMSAIQFDVCVRYLKQDLPTVFAVGLTLWGVFAYLGIFIV